MVDAGDESRDLIHVLVIDDDEEMQKLMLAILVPRGYQVFAVGSAEQGLELLPYHTFDLAFLDQNLPGMEGLVLGEYLRKNNPRMRIALVTGSEDPKLERMGGAHEIEVIRKPFEVRQILEVLDRWAEDTERERSARAEAADPDFAPRFEPLLAELGPAFEPIHAPERLIERLIQVVRTSLAELRTERRYNEKDRVVALVGLLALLALGAKIPKGNSGQSLLWEYDQAMLKQGRRPEFGAAPDDPAD